MVEENKISIAVIKRLPRYYRYLGELLANGVTRISSKELSRRMNITASQIRQDLNNFGCFGQQGYGYNVVLLYEEIKKILGLDKNYNMIICGLGNLGKALSNYYKFDRLGFNFIGLFDISQEMVGTTWNNIRVGCVSELESFLAENEVDIAVLTLPKTSACKISQTLVNGGVKGIWNFSNVDLHIPDSVRVENVHLTDSLMVLSYGLNEG